MEVCILEGVADTMVLPTGVDRGEGDGGGDHGGVEYGRGGRGRGFEAGRGSCGRGTGRG